MIQKKDQTITMYDKVKWAQPEERERDREREGHERDPSSISRPIDF
jgi:hypothetical protein